MATSVNDILPARSKDALKRLELLARKTVGGIMHGLHASRRLGVSVDFDHHKIYQPGDAVRHIDWRASAKHDRLYVKRHREDTSLNVHLLLDFSASMMTDTGPDTKAAHANLLAACLAYLITNQNDRISLLAMCDGEILQRPLGSSGLHLVEILTVLISHEPQGKDDIVRHLNTLVSRNTARGVVVFVSDLMYEPTAVQRELAKLHHQGHEIVVINIRDRQEEQFAFNQWIRFTDDEKQYAPAKVDTVLLGRLYVEEYRTLMAAWETWSKAQDVHFRPSYAHAGAEATLVDYINYRNRIRRH